ncbi:MAG TPA: hypothetical protein VG319_05800 [Polyangia bacterium]|nr:hypothetical protein [Polyangia bacterium]
MIAPAAACSSAVAPASESVAASTAWDASDTSPGDAEDPASAASPFEELGEPPAPSTPPGTIGACFGDEHRSSVAAQALIAAAMNSRRESVPIGATT